MNTHPPAFKNRLKIMLWLLLLPFIAISQNWPAGIISVNINSGNPKFPFPQFNEYAKGKSLALYNPVGVVHAEMEQTTRDAYRIMMNRAIYSGETMNSVKYIMFNHSSVPANYGTFVSEGDGYALLAAAYMGDKTTFDGLWGWIHDNRLSKVKSYLGCNDVRPTYKFGANLPGWSCDKTSSAGGTDVNSATDGDVDIALALVVAYRQWGEFMGVFDGCGKAISYKQEAINFLRAMVDTVYWDNGSLGFSPGSGYLTGDIGIDGYVKSGNTWDEQTSWAWTSPSPAYAWAKKPSVVSISSKYVDYIAPAYFHAFADFMTETGQSAWSVSQYKRAEASSDWLMGKLYAQGSVAYAGDVQVSNNGSTVTFGSFSDGEDFRLPWRTISNYMWHGDPKNNWDPAIHALSAGSNSYELDNGVRIAKLLKKPSNFPGNTCGQLGSDPSDVKFDGNTMMYGTHLASGAPKSSYIYMNWTHGTSSPAAVVSGDIVTTAKTYRQCELEWDVVDDKPPVGDENARYINSTPKYFHGWFRLLGLLTTTGNWHTPNDLITPVGNMKVYKAVSKTYGYKGDTLKYTISYRNYASIAATGVKIEDQLPAEVSFVSASNGGTFAGGKITWNIGTVPGFQSASGVAPTKGFVTVVCKINVDSARFCNTAKISCTNGTGWTSNEYPNNITATMERNCVDVVKRALIIDKTADRLKMNPGNIVEFTVNWENSSSAGWLNGGRPGITLTHGYGYSGPNTFNQYYRIYHGAEEAYIDYGNYRVSYYLNNPAVKGLFPADPNGWKMGINYLEGGNLADVKFSFQKVPFGTDASNGRKWDQRLTTKFAPALAATTQHLYKYFGVTGRVHRGVSEPFRTMIKLETTPSSVMSAGLQDDWSFDGDASTLNVGSNDKSTLYPITPDWTDPYNLGIPVNKIHVDECRTKAPNFDRVLVEEFDGYTWRRAFGRGPLPGRETYNVVVRDTLPADLDWISFIDDEALGVKATYDPTTRIIKWEIPVMLVGEKGEIKYKASAKGICPIEKNFKNWAWISSATDSPIGDSVPLNITCKVLPPLPPAKTTMTKTADKTSYSVGDAIKYTIAYEQTQGSIAAPSLATNTDWKAQGASPLPSFASNQINFSFASPNNMLTYDYSHGKNGTIEGRIGHDPSQDLGIVCRYISGSGAPGATANNGVFIKLTAVSDGMTGTVYNGTTLVATSGKFLYAGAGIMGAGNKLFYDFKVELNGPNLKLWIGNTSGPEAFNCTGILEQAGYAGFYNYTQWGNHVVTAFKTNLDSGFDLKMEDAIPAEVIAPINISDAGSVTAGVIDWTLSTPAKTPVLYGTKFTRTWDGTVNSCSEFIVNTAYANLYGQVKNTIGAQNIVTCATSTTACVKPSAVISGGGAICAGDSIKLKVVLTGTANWKLRIKNGSTITKVQSITKSPYEFYAKAAGTYVIDSVWDANCDTLGKGAGTIVSIKTAPTATISGAATLCQGDSTLLSVALTGSASWKIKIGNGALITSVSGIVKSPYTFWVKTAGTYKVDSVWDANCAAKGSDTVLIKVNALPTFSTTGSTALCAGDTAKINLTASGKTPYTISKIEGSTKTNYISSAANFIVPFTTAGSDSIKLIDGNGCKALDKIMVITEHPKVKAAFAKDSMSVCAGTPVNLSPVVTGGTAPFGYAWTGLASGSGSSYTASKQGFYYVEVNDNVGCKSRDTVFVIVSANLNVQLNNSSICVADSLLLDAGYDVLHYKLIWNTNDTTQTVKVKTAGTYGVVVQTRGGGCKGSDSMNLAMFSMPNVELGADKNICAGPLNFATINATPGFKTYTWLPSGNTATKIAKKGKYYLTVTDANSCKATDSTEVFETAAPIPNVISDIESCAGTNVTFDESTFDNGNGIYTYLWNNNSTASSLQLIAIAKDSLVWVEVSDKFGCKGKDSAQISIKANLPVQIKGLPDTTLCAGGAAITLSSQYKTFDGYTFAWTGGATGAAEDILVSTPGIIYLEVSSGGCKGNDTIDIAVNAAPNMKLMPLSKSICDGTAATIGYNYGANYDYEWKDAGNSVISTDSLLQISVGGTYTITVKNTSTTCIADTIVTVSTHNKPLANIGSPIDTCDNAQVTLSEKNTQPNVKYTWTKASTGDTVLDSSATLNIQKSDHYTLRVSNEFGCFKDTSANVIFRKMPKINLLGSDTASRKTICEGQTLLLNADNNDAQMSYLWMDGKNTATYNASTSGIYIVEVRNAQCRAKDTLYLQTISLPENVLNDKINAVKTTYCFDEEGTVLLSALAADSALNTYTYLWNTGATSPTIAVNKGGTYKVKISVDQCSVNDDFTFIDYCLSTFFVPNSFTPNGDGKNESFAPQGIHVNDYELLIFNRWGEQIFVSTNFTDAWDGTVNGKKVQEDVYVWKIRYSINLETGKKLLKEKVGHVSVIY